MKKTKRGDYERTVTFPMFKGYTIHIVFTDDISRSRKMRYGTEGNSRDAAAMHSSAVGGHAHLFYPLPSDVEIIAHEAYHAIYCMLTDWCGEPEMPNEIAAYLVGYLVGKIVDFQYELKGARNETGNIRRRKHSTKA